MTCFLEGAAVMLVLLPVVSKLGQYMAGVKIQYVER
jgi:hypothetical protein